MTMNFDKLSETIGKMSLTEVEKYNNQLKENMTVCYEKNDQVAFKSLSQIRDLTETRIYCLNEINKQKSEVCRRKMKAQATQSIAEVWKTAMKDMENLGSDAVPASEIADMKQKASDMTNKSEFVFETMTDTYADSNLESDAPTTNKYWNQLEKTQKDMEWDATHKNKLSNLTSSSRNEQQLESQRQRQRRQQRQRQKPKKQQSFFQDDSEPEVVYRAQKKRVNALT